MSMSGPSRAAAAVLAVALVVSATAAVPAQAPGPKARFDRVRAQEAETRAAVEQVPPTAGTTDIDRVVRPARRVVADYEGVVRRFPTSGYADNALHQAAALSQWLYDRYGRAADRTAATRFYTWLIREYPASSLRAGARAGVRALETPAADGRPAPALSPAAAAPAAASRARPAERVLPSAPVAPVAAAAPLSPPRPTSGPAAPVTLRSIDREVLDDTVRVTLGFDREAPFVHEIIGGPPRAFVDVFGAVAAETLTDATIRFDGDAVRQVRVGRRPNAVRVVLDLDGAGRVSVFTLYNPYRVVIDADRRLPPRATRAAAAGLPAAPAAPVPATAVAAPPDVVLADDSRVPLDPAADVAPAMLETPAATVLPPALALADTTPPPAPPTVAAPPPAALPAAPAASLPAAPLPASNAAAPTPLRASAAEVPPSAAPGAPSRNANGTFSMARQLGLGISRIVIDPGHGGHDPGTPTSGTNEARLVLDVALRLEKLLVKDGFDVVLTRRSDVFVPLEERTAIANRERADLFLSIHANSGRDPKARGVEVYYLSFASNPEAEAVAARENATSNGGMHNLTGIVRAIALNNKLDESRDFAQLVQASLASRLAPVNQGLRNRGVKKAPFVVLIGAQMPSVLAEIGFITNRPEVALMKTPAYRQRIAEALQSAVGQYQRALKSGTAAVATR
jgi:N-acetylmuramoyl-L-alanine amidase